MMLQSSGAVCVYGVKIQPVYVDAACDGHAMGVYAASSVVSFLGVQPAMVMQSVFMVYTLQWSPSM